MTGRVFVPRKRQGPPRALDSQTRRVAARPMRSRARSRQYRARGGGAQSPDDLEDAGADHPMEAQVTEGIYASGKSTM